MNYIMSMILLAVGISLGFATGEALGGQFWALAGFHLLSTGIAGFGAVWAVTTN